MSDRASSGERNVKEGTPNGSTHSYSPDRRHKRPASRSKSGSRERDRSRSYTPKRRQRSRSPGSNRRRHVGDRDNPTPSRCLGVFGLSLYTQTRHLRDVFSKYGNIDEITIVTDAQTGRSRGFAFVYFEQSEDAKSAKDDCNGIEIDNRKIRVDFSITKRPHTPTPGIYMGRPSQGLNSTRGSGRFSRRARGRRGYGYSYGSRYDDRYEDRRDYGRREYRDDYYRDDYRGGRDDYRGGRDDYRRSPSPYYGGGRRGYRRSRSRSYSPRRDDYAGRYRY